MLLKPSRIEKVNPKCSWKFKFVGIIGLGIRTPAKTSYIYLTKNSPLRLEAIFRKLRLGPMFEQFEMQVVNGKKGHRERCVAVAPRLLVRTTCTSVGTSAFDMSPLLHKLWKWWGFFGGADFVGKRLNTLYAESVSEDLNSPNMGLKGGRFRLVGRKSSSRFESQGFFYAFFLRNEVAQNQWTCSSWSPLKRQPAMNFVGLFFGRWIRIPDHDMNPLVAR